MTPEGIAKIKEHEGLRLVAYKCPTGHWTIGYGHTSDRHREVVPGLKITQEEADRLLLLDLGEAEQDARRIVPDFNALSPHRQDALVNWAFQIGYGGMRTFTNTMNYIRTGRWEQAAQGLEKSLWFKQTQPSRTSYVISAIREG